MERIMDANARYDSPRPVTARMRATVRVARALFSFAKGSIPKPLLPVFAVCLLIPGPFDELALLVTVAAVVLRSGPKRAELRNVVSDAWHTS